MKRDNTQHPRGFVLLMALLLIAVAGVTMAGIARASLARAVQAKTAANALQLRWGQLSCQAALLPHAQKLLEQAQEDSREPVTSVPVAVSLGGMAFEALLSDEQAKANVNTVYQNTDRQTTEKRIKDTLRTSDGPPVAVRLTPLKPRQSEQVDKRASALPAFGSLEQVFDAAPGRLFNSASNPSPAIGLFTCWGSGKLNFRLASREALRAVCRGLLDDRGVEQLITNRQDKPELELEQALAQLALIKEKQDKLAGLLTDSSACFSLWVAANDGRRVWHRLAVAITTPSDSGNPTPGGEQQVTAEFVW